MGNAEIIFKDECRKIMGTVFAALNVPYQGIFH